ncbi:MAG: twin transmembrane helix small protein [Alphaproteobacteria bacterium]|nr:twin transmembrane helix small protein [Alphaproteobacteria bacterium]
MDKFFFIAALICMAGVVASLFLGLWAMTKDTKKDHKTSNIMMRFRVLFQGLTILFLLLAYFSK